MKYTTFKIQNISWHTLWMQTY